MSDEAPQPDLIKRIASLEKRLHLLEEAVGCLIDDGDRHDEGRRAIFAAMGGLVSVLSSRRLLVPGDVDRIMQVTEEIAAMMEKAVADGLSEDAPFKDQPRGRRRKKRPRARK